MNRSDARLMRSYKLAGGAQENAQWQQIQSQHRTQESSSSLSGVLRGLLILLFLVAGLVSALSWGVFPLFRLESVALHGKHAIPDEELVQLSGLRSGQSLWQIDREAVEKLLEQDPRIEKAELRLDWPSRVELLIQERRPLAHVLGQGLLDSKGAFWQNDRRAFQMDLPLITGVEERLENNDAFWEELAFQVLALESALPERALSELHWDSGQWIAFFEQGPGPVLLPTQGLTERLDSLSKLMKKWPTLGKSRVDLRWQGRIVVEPHPGLEKPKSDKRRGSA